MLKKIEELLEAGKIDEEVAKALNDDFEPEFKKLRDEAAQYRVQKKEIESQLKERYESELSELKKQIDEAKRAGESEAARTYEEKLKQIEAERNELADKARRATLEATLKGGLSKFDVVDPDAVEAYIERMVTFDGDTPKIKLGESVLDFEEGMKKIFESKPNLLKSQGNPGSGAGTPPSGGSGKYWEDMQPEERKAYFEEHGKLPPKKQQQG